MSMNMVVAGGGIGGLSVALACARGGAAVSVHEQADAFSEAGAGIQLGPNATRVLASWGLANALDEVAAQPGRLIIRSAHDDRELAAMDLRPDMVERYGSRYATIHRADLQGLLLRACVDAGVVTHTASRIVEATQPGDGVALRTGSDVAISADVLVAADGIWSTLRGQVADDAIRSTGHVAFRALTAQAGLPERCRSSDITVWLGPRMHVVRYPVRGGDFLNMVVLAEGVPKGDAQDWSEHATAAELRDSVAGVASGLRERIEAMPAWRLWTLHDRAPLRGAHQMAKGRIALLGDAAHPMLPYLAQGAGMSIEDGCVLARWLAAVQDASDVPAALQGYARERWQRCARVQAVARRNAVVFHARGPLAWGRDAAMRALGERLLDQPWLYR